MMSDLMLVEVVEVVVVVGGGGDGGGGGGDGEGGGFSKGTKIWWKACRISPCLLFVVFFLCGDQLVHTL